MQATTRDRRSLPDGRAPLLGLSVMRLAPSIDVDHDNNVLTS
jgi:hypothetical protein